MTMLKKLFRLTQEGADELREELERLIAERSVIADHIKTAREFGDLAENAEYQSAQAEQEKNELRISEIEHILQNVEIIRSSNGGSKVVQLGGRVKLKSADGKHKAFQVVGTVEADPLEGKISDESPIGKSLLGKKVGETIEIKTPTETAIYEIIEIA
ncbi:MAG TPA: transcription elongation factor GreA [Candidatus Saccharimonadales bacterium]|nr:transcription elongation factor GreA [Candidatus Saccharimonadales bacterium]